MAGPGLKRRSARQAVSRVSKRSKYEEWDSDNDDFLVSGAELEPEQAEEQQPSQPPPRKRAKLASRPKRQTRSKSSKSKSKSKSLVVGRPRKSNTLAEAAPKREFTGPSDKKIPPWTKLPINILNDVFFYASRPLHEHTSVASANAIWLLKAARTCRAFTLPALEAYYKSPAIFTSLQPHRLLELLQVPKDQRFFDYNVKVQSLIIDVWLLAYTAHNRGPFDLSALTAELPQLQHIEIQNPDDLPPFRSTPKQRWYYPADLFQALTEHGQRLRTWRWSRKMIAERESAAVYDSMLQVHSSKPFEYIEKLVVCGFDVIGSAEPEALDAPEGEISVVPPGLATSIAVLPNLKDLTFVSCDIIMEKFLERLPLGLERLELTNCLEIHSDMLESYFVNAGTGLRELVLSHNPALTLAFLPNLKKSCPKLEVLKMDLRYFSERLNSNDADPLYDELLKDDEIPTWPTTLKHLELVQVQRCSAEAAQNLFRSLIDGAEALPDLRHLTLQSHINIPWRDRAGFRDQWIERLQRVFLRKSAAPIPYLGSLRQWRLWKQAQTDSRVTTIIDSDNEPLIRRKASAVQASPHKATGETDYYSDSAPEPSSRQPRRSTRVVDTLVSQASATASVTQTSDSESNEEEVGWRKTPEKFIQGLCDVVDISIDNQRPRENQFTEGDFLDEEASGDEDWHEGADDGDDDRYAW